MKRKHRLSVRFLSAALALIGLSVLPANADSFAANADETMEVNPMLTCTAADDWNALFDRKGQKNTWLAADGIYSVSLDGNDAMGSLTESSKNYFIFSDTIIGTANSSGKIQRFNAMPNHTAALLTGNASSSATLDFYYGAKGSCDLSGELNLFEVREWLFDCFVLNGKLYIFGFEEQNWKPARIDLITVPIKDGEVDLENYSRNARVSSRLLYTDSDFSYAYGMGILNHTEAAGAVNPDGYIYIYGYRDNFNNFSQKDLIVSRIAASDFPDLSKLRYWNGTEWADDIKASATLLDRVSCEVSVTPVASGPYAGKYIAIYTQDVQSAHMMYAIGDTPAGPFSEPVEFYTAPETGQPCTEGSGTLYTYNAKAHPNLSDDRYLLITYNVNANNGSYARHTDDYIPRFLYLDLWAGGDYSETLPDRSDDPPSDDSLLSENNRTDIRPGISTSYLPLIVGAAVIVCAAAGGIIAVKIKNRKKKADSEINSPFKQ